MTILNDFQNISFLHSTRRLSEELEHLDFVVNRKDVPRKRILAVLEPFHNELFFAFHEVDDRDDFLIEVIEGLANMALVLIAEEKPNGVGTKSKNTDTCNNINLVSILKGARDELTKSNTGELPDISKVSKKIERCLEALKSAEVLEWYSQKVKNHLEIARKDPLNSLDYVEKAFVLAKSKYFCWESNPSMSRLFYRQLVFRLGEKLAKTMINKLRVDLEEQGFKLRANALSWHNRAKQPLNRRDKLSGEELFEVDFKGSRKPI